MTTADKLLTQIKEDREIRAKAGKMPGTKQLQGDLLVVFEESSLYSCEEDNEEFSQFIAHAANNWERKNRQLEIAVEAINAARATFDAIYSFKPDDQIRTSAFGGSVELKQALEDMEAVK